MEDTDGGRGGIPSGVKDGLQGIFPPPGDGNVLLLPMVELIVTNYYFLEVISNLQKLQYSWGRLIRIMGQKVAYARTLGHLYLDIIQDILIFG